MTAAEDARITAAANACDTSIAYDGTNSALKIEYVSADSTI